MISSDLLNLISILQWFDYFLFLNWREDVLLDGFPDWPTFLKWKILFWCHSFILLRSLLVSLSTKIAFLLTSNCHKLSKPLKLWSWMSTTYFSSLGALFQMNLKWTVLLSSKNWLTECYSKKHVLTALSLSFNFKFLRTGNN